MSGRKPNVGDPLVRRNIEAKVIWQGDQCMIIVYPGESLKAARAELRSLGYTGKFQIQTVRIVEQWFPKSDLKGFRV